jgi:hypothetical protein
MRTFMTTPAVIRRFIPDVDEYGNEIRDAQFEDTPIKCWVAPQKAGIYSEDTFNRNQSVGAYTVFIRGDHNLNFDDQIIIGEPEGSGSDPSMILEILGPPNKFPDRRGRVSHIQADCREYRG